VQERTKAKLLEKEREKAQKAETAGDSGSRFEPIEGTDDPADIFGDDTVLEQAAAEVEAALTLAEGAGNGEGKADALVDDEQVEASLEDLD